MPAELHEIYGCNTNIRPDNNCNYQALPAYQPSSSYPKLNPYVAEPDANAIPPSDISFEDVINLIMSNTKYQDILKNILCPKDQRQVDKPLNSQGGGGSNLWNTDFKKFLMYAAGGLLLLYCVDILIKFGKLLATK